MEITNEIKAKIFAQYLGQKVYRNEFYDKHSLPSCKVNVACLENLENNNSYLQLKSLTSMHDEDAIEVAKMQANMSIDLTKEENVIDAINYTKKVTIHYTSFNWKSYQYLQSKGYDMPHYLLDGKTLQESGLCIYETI